MESVYYLVQVRGAVSKLSLVGWDHGLLWFSISDPGSLDQQQQHHLPDVTHANLQTPSQTTELETLGIW